MVGLLPLCAATTFEGELHGEVPRDRRSGSSGSSTRAPSSAPRSTTRRKPGVAGRRLASILDETKLRRVLAKMLDENEFLSPYGIRSLSRYHADHPYVIHAGGQEYRVSYLPAESDTGMFGGNSNWRGPIWMPVNALIIRALLQYYLYYGDDFTVECPTGSGRRMNLYQVAEEIARRLAAHLPARTRTAGARSIGGTRKFQEDPHWRDCLLFYEYFHGDNGAGLGASHQTGWTGVIARAHAPVRDPHARAGSGSRQTILFRNPGPGENRGSGDRSSLTLTPSDRAQASFPGRVRLPINLRRDNSMSHGSSRAATLEAKAVGTLAAEACSTSSQLPALPRYPSLYQINTRVWLTELSRTLGRPRDAGRHPGRRAGPPGGDGVRLDLVPERLADRPGGAARLAQQPGVAPGIPGDAARPVRGGHRGLRVRHHRLHGARAAGRGRRARPAPRAPPPARPAADARLRPQPHGPGSSLGRGPSRVLRPGDRARPGPGARRTTPGSSASRAIGSWPTAAIRTFPGWPDALQLNYGNPATQEAMIGELLKIAGQCDGVRCDMAMLVLPDVFERTWGIRPSPSGRRRPGACGSRPPSFCFMAEVYWDLEWTLQQQGFDYTYDKRLYDRLRDGHARPVREHFRAGLDYQDKLARFLENHDEPRAAAVFPPGVHEAAAVITFLSPGLRFFHQGQFEGRQKRISPHLGRGPTNPSTASWRRSTSGCSPCCVSRLVRDGRWQLLDARPPGKGTGPATASWPSPGKAPAESG